MTNTKQRAYITGVAYQETLNKYDFVATCFLPESSGKQQRKMRSSLKEHQMQLHYIKLNIFQILLKTKSIGGINNKLGLIYLNDTKNLLNILSEHKIIISNLFYKNIIINPIFLTKKLNQLPNFSNLIFRSDLTIKKPIITIMTIINKINDNKQPINKK